MPKLPTPSEIVTDNHAAAERHASEHGTVTPDAAIATLEAALTGDADARDRDRDRDATRVSIAKLRTQADAAGPVDAMRLRAAADRLEADLTADEVGTIPVFTPTRQALLRVLMMVQNCPRYVEQDIMTICGFLSTGEVSDHLWANFRNLPEADKARVLDALRIEANAALAEAA